MITVEPVRAKAPTGLLRIRPQVEWTLIVLGLLNLILVQPKGLNADGYYRYLQLTQLLLTGTLPDGDYSLVGPSFSTPMWLIGHAFGHAAMWLRYYNIALFCLGLAAIAFLLRRHVEAALLRRFLLLLVAASIVAPSLNDFYGEAFTLVGVGVGLLAALTGPRRVAIAGWVAVVLGAVNTPASLIGVALIAFVEVVRRRRLRILAVPLAAAALVALEIGLRHGGYVGAHGAQTIMPYSGKPGFSYPIILGIAAILFSFGRGLLYFFPGLALPASHRIRAAAGPEIARVYHLWLLFLAGLIIVYAGWWAWHGGWSWGPRFFVIAILPASLALAVRLNDTDSRPLADVLTLGALLLSVWGAIASTVYFGYWPPQCYAPGGIEELCHFAPEFSQLWWPMLAKPHLDATQIVLLCYYTTVALWLAAPVGRRIFLAIRKAAARWPRTGWQL
ncbi:hypothetical protein Rhe02_07650 [Rhizocola hellebori]|uniref:Uncharacterized protein n=1 Tax=Rhizocola hellebori TaxID=1392758 RepID=A0A8J3VE19_9ACTN|nr:hypothetical protein [Rhizocola hellebori]GIH02698.1 hypothetical protein Rhe02_07650 [Rhizocola hellebori]